ncbi:duboraya [Dunckerocampus dactyliophorus]|uniref:duboraya n=1 Tax=Dunckerocampus dactyliophorus TaxID=161453 RepID=UPI002405EB41|nr:duboraya [Dunckerocampus dactyliophorus]
MSEEPPGFERNMQGGRAQETQEEALSRPSVAELAGRFKGSSSPTQDAAVRETERPVRRRPPRSLQLPKIHGDEREMSAGVTSPVKVKRNSALIEKLQANLALSPSALLPSPKSPGFRLLPLFSPPPSPSPTAGTPLSTLSPSSPVSTCLLVTEEEGPTSFEAPPTAMEGSLLTNINKGRARHSLRRRPPSRRHRKSSSGDEVGVATEQTDTPSSQLDHETTERDGEGRLFNNKNGDHVEESKSDETKPNYDVTLQREDEDKEEEGGEDQKSDGVGEEEGNKEKSSGDDQNNPKEQKSNGSTCQS